MPEQAMPPQVAIVDYGLGNLFSVQQACLHAGLSATISDDHAVISAARVVILPGVGAFGDAMANLRAKGLDRLLVDLAGQGKPLVGICLGLQLLMEQSQEFGEHRGLGLLPGQVVRFQGPRGPEGALKVPQVGWNAVLHPPGAGDDPWRGTLLQGLPAGVPMYFVHSYHVVTSEPSLVLSWSQYGDVGFCSAMHRQNIYGLQYHPERSGAMGLQVYSNLRLLIQGSL